MAEESNTLDLTTQEEVVEEDFMITAAMIFAWFVYKNGWKETISWIKENPIKTGAMLGAGAVAHGMGEAIFHALSVKFSSADPEVIKTATSEIVSKYGDKIQSMLS